MRAFLRAVAWVCVATALGMGYAQGFDGGVSETLQSIYIPPLVGAPFTAVVHTEWSRPIPGGGTYTVVNERRVGRDARGRIYEERWLLVPKDSDIRSRMNVFQIADPHEHTLYNCWTMEKRCNRLKFAEPAVEKYEPSIVPDGPLGGNKGFATHVELGTQMIAGLETVGTRQTITMLPGTLGNDRPLVTTREFWQATQIGVNLLSIIEGPRVGRQTFKVTEVSLSEPDPKVFEIPAGYEVVQGRR